MSSTYFISDVHLDADRPELFTLLEHFLSRHRDAAALYILGDLFEAWIGDDDDAPLAVQTRALLKRYSDSGPQLFLMRGNRDFLLGEHFAHACGATLLPDPTVIDLYGTPTLLMHGDSLCTGDTEYQAFRAAVRRPEWQAATLALALDERRELAKNLRSESMAATNAKETDIMDVTPGEVEKYMARHGVPQLLHGHTHRPHRHDTRHGTRWVLGDWGDSAWVLQAQQQAITLVNIV